MPHLTRGEFPPPVSTLQVVQLVLQTGGFQAEDRREGVQLSRPVPRQIIQRERRQRREWQCEFQEPGRQPQVGVAGWDEKAKVAGELTHPLDELWGREEFGAPP